MKATGITRPIDGLGRIVIPKEIRKALGLVDDQDSMEFFIDGEMVVLRRYVPGCVFCNGMGDLKLFRGHQVCGNCRGEIGNRLTKEKPFEGQIKSLIKVYQKDK